MKNFLRKFAYLLFIPVFCFCLAACGSNNDQDAIDEEQIQEEAPIENVQDAQKEIDKAFEKAEKKAEEYNDELNNSAKAIQDSLKSTMKTVKDSVKSQMKKTIDSANSKTQKAIKENLQDRMSQNESSADVSRMFSDGAGNDTERHADGAADDLRTEYIETLKQQIEDLKADKQF
ncbi:MAG: hypothetical protein IKH10_03935, partial [Bacteroidetes bacterium]|nr:hypothetical protein [Bacteroidota bacterium]